MPKYVNKLVVLRGNSGSGKTTTAKEIRKLSRGKIAIIEQDYFRRFVLKEKEADDGDNIQLIESMVTYALSKSYDVILEGILYFPRYGDMLNRLRSMCPNNYFYYFDIPLEETLHRHATKQNAHEYGEKEMREWFHPKDLTHFSNEKTISTSSTLEKTVEFIKSDSGL